MDIEGEEYVDEVGMATQMASPADELVLIIEEGILLEVVVEDVALEVEDEVIAEEMDSMSEHHGRDVVVEEEEALGTARSEYIVQFGGEINIQTSLH